MREQVDLRSSEKGNISKYKGLKAVLICNITVLELVHITTI